MNATRLSVALCTHEPQAGYFNRALDGLRRQFLSTDQWELLVVDNASSSPVTADLTWHAQGRLIREDKLGLTHARLRAFAESNAPLLVLVDDDNVLAPDYLERALAIAEKWPILGSWGGRVIPEFAVTPEEWTREYWPWIAIREFDRDVWSNVPRSRDTAPCGAGLCVRREVAQAYGQRVREDPVRQSLDRIGTKLFGGGDTDLALTSSDLGLGNGLFTELKVTHLIPASRVQEGYLLRLTREMTYSSTLLDYVRGQRPILPSRTQRLLRWYESLWIFPRQRRFAQASLEGLEAAVGDIERIEKNGHRPG